MKEFPSCFGESGVQIFHPSSSSSSSNTNKSTGQNLVTCVYQYHSQTFSGFITVTWIKHLMAQGLNIGIENSTKESLCKVDIKPWLFSKKKGFRNLTVSNSTKVHVYWDLSCAKFGSSPEPLEGFYLAIALNQELCLLLGDSPNEALRKTDLPCVIPKANHISKREHIFGRRLYDTKARFLDKGKLHDVRIEYDPNKCLTIYIDRSAVLQVTRLVWKFRGNETILVDGISVEVYWDVYDWLFGSVVSSAVFLFRCNARGGEKGRPWSRRGLLETSALERSKDKMMDSHSHSQQGLGFSLVLCAWKNE